MLQHISGSAAHLMPAAHTHTTAEIALLGFRPWNVEQAATVKQVSSERERERDREHTMRCSESLSTIEPAGRALSLAPLRAH